MSISYRSLEIFTKVYEKRNMTLAAEGLFISQPSVSLAIRELETQYDTPLFERFPRELRPTAKGDMLYHYAKQLLQLQKEVDYRMQSEEDEITFTIGANISVGVVLIHNYLKLFREMYPRAKVFVRVSGSERLKKMLVNHEIDFALIEESMKETNLVQEPFYKDRIVMAVSPEHPLAHKKNLRYKDFENMDFLLRERGVGVRNQFDYLMAINNVQYVPLWESGNNEALINAAKENYGIGVFPFLLVMEELKAGELVELDVAKDSLSRNLNIVYLKDKIFPPQVEDFLELIREMNLTS